MNPISIRFPMVKEPTGNRRGPRLRRVPDKSRLHGAAACAAGMVSIAIRKRDLAATPPGYRDPAHVVLGRRIDRACMRTNALWARVFAGQIDEDDARLYDRSCPVCATRKDKKEDLVCASCWTLIPTADQAELIRLRKEANGSDSHRIKCSAVVRDLDRRRTDLAATNKP